MAWVGFSYNAPSVRTDEEAKKAGRRSISHHGDWGLTSATQSRAMSQEAIRERLAFFNET